MDLADSNDLSLRNADSFKEIQQEVALLQRLRDMDAKNVNLIVEAFIFDTSMWIVSDYCTGGSVHTLVSQFLTLVFLEASLVIV